MSVNVWKIWSGGVNAQSVSCNEILCSYHSGDDHVVGPANNLKSALQLAELPNLDGALLDLSINGEYATKVADKLRTRSVPFIFVTGYDRPPGLRYRDVSVLHKPFSQIDLRMALISLLEKSPDT